MEMEAWFIAEHHHFRKWDKRLTYQKVMDSLGHDLRTLEFEGLAHPTKTMNSIYKIFGKGYKKNKHFVTKVVHCLDMEHFYLEVRKKSSGISRFLDRIDAFLA
jgi:hypothetical protein